MRTTSMRTFVLFALCSVVLTLPAPARAQDNVVRAEDEIKDTNETAALERKKLELEIKDLEEKRNTWSKASQILPLLTTFIAVAGLLLTIYKDRTDRKRELAARDTGHIRDDMNQLLSLAPDKETSTGMVSFLLDDLNQLVERNADRRGVVSNALITFIREDCDFDKLRHIHLDIECIERWGDYKKYLIDNPYDHAFIVYKFFQSFRHLHDEDQDYFENIKYVKEEDRFEVESMTEVETRYLRFLALMRAYTLHLELLKPEAKKEAIKQFQQAMNNASLTEEYFLS